MGGNGVLPLSPRRVNLPEKPRAGVGPVALRGRRGDAEDFGGCVDREAGEVAQLHEFGFTRASERAMRAAVCELRARVNAHSHTRSTVQPAARRARETARSRCAFRASFGCQYARRDEGTRPWRGQPCQKQPSTNTATFSARKTKSGLPGSGAPRRQPVMRCSRINAIKRSSVARFPRERMSDITALRFARVNTSAIRTKRSEPLGQADEASLLHLLANTLH